MLPWARRLACCVLLSAPVLRDRLRTASSLFALVAALTLTSPASAADGTVAATEMSGFGRFVFTLDKPVKAQVRSSSGI
eukprot:gene6923-9198_t